jgi:hypothetical protein
MTEPIRCALCGQPVERPGYINAVAYCRTPCYGEAMWQKKLTMRPPTGVDNLLNLIDEDTT